MTPVFLTYSFPTYANAAFIFSVGCFSGHETVRQHVNFPG
jgi:hypothetical protein